MNDISEFKKYFEPALRGILNNWRGWAGSDEIRALHIGFDCTNTEIAVSLLTDREPYLEEQALDPFDDKGRWPVADWRLSSLNRTWNHSFPDAAEVLAWMERQSNELEGDPLNEVNEALRSCVFEISTGEAIQRELKRFRRIASPFRVRVEWFFGDEPSDAELVL